MYVHVCVTHSALNMYTIIFIAENVTSYGCLHKNYTKEQILMCADFPVCEAQTIPHNSGRKVAG